MLDERVFNQNEIMEELPQEEIDFWFNYSQKKFLHNIDTFYYSIKFHNDFRSSSEALEVILMRRFFRPRLEQIQTEYGSFLPLEFPGVDMPLNLRPFSFAGYYNICLEYPDYFDLFIALSVPGSSDGNESVTCEWVVQLRSYLRNNDFKKDGVDYHAAADLTGQANHLGVTIKADIVKQKLPSNNGGFTAINFGKVDKKMYTELTTEHPIDLCRYQVANGYMGRVGLINSGGESHGASDLKEAVITAVINKRAGGMGLISGRKAFQRSMKDGVELLHTIQDVYLDPEITIA